MELSPGLTYLLGVFPRFAIPSIITYLSLYLLEKREISVGIPSWAAVILAVFARPIILVFGYYHSIWADKRAAAANNAVLAPPLPKSQQAIISELGWNTRHGHPGQVMHQWTQEFGNVVRFNILTSSAMITVEPEHVKAILATQFDSFEKGPVFFSQAHSLLGEGVFNSDGEMWKFHRAMTRPFFTRERITDFEIYDRNWNISLQIAKERLAEGFSLDIQDLISRFTLDSATEFLFGGEVGSLSAGIPYPPSHKERNSSLFYNHPSTSFINAFTESLSVVLERTNLGKEWPLWELKSDKITPLRRIIDGFTDPLLKKLSTPKARSFRLLLRFVTDTGLNLDPKILKDELINLLVAGRDTTMCLLTYAVYMLAEHPDIEKRLREEIFTKVGPTEAPKYDQMREMRYVKAFLNALEFDPDRFLDERVQKYLVPNPFIFCPFNAGPRICLGQQFAYNEATFYLVRLLQNFTEFTLDNSINVARPAEWNSGDSRMAKETIHPTAHLTMFVKDGLWIKMKELAISEV
ncbi:hypothetical protein CVT25_002560 [Psilocybe cyanescens]|uniref:Cytochrome P450 n=1 Tax=Psilocybe cyanescens TaxID=93625 RepID=A0A409WLM8_PSICY|nr:hypothetical protein CVT25_002560 [Psilocybe cyanescens]